MSTSGEYVFAITFKIRRCCSNVVYAKDNPCRPSSPTVCSCYASQMHLEEPPVCMDNTTCMCDHHGLDHFHKVLAEEAGDSMHD